MLIEWKGIGKIIDKVCYNKIMKNLFYILSIIILVIGILCLEVFIIQNLINYLLDYFEVAIKRLNFIATFVIILICYVLFKSYNYKK